MTEDTDDLPGMTLIGPCECICHTHPGVMHVAPCCNKTYEQYSEAQLATVAEFKQILAEAENGTRVS